MPEPLLNTNDVIHGTHGDYIILSLIGRGGMGAVYRTQRMSDRTIWALKEMRPPPNLPNEEVEENRKLFEQEARLLSSLSHPNIPILADYFEYDGRPVMVMEFVDGQTLENLIHKSKATFTESQIISYGVQLCRVLDYLHTRNPPIIYRDLKPPNIMITLTGVMKLIDFGVARTRKEQKSKDTIAMGSAGYAPPEQYGKAQTDARSDIYALGATLLHLATGIPPIPFQPPRPGDIRKHMPSMKVKTERIIIKAMSLKRDERYTSCSVMEQALLKCLDTPYVDPTAQVVTPVSIQVTDNKVQTAQPPLFQPPPLSAKPDGIECKHCEYVNKASARFCARCGMPIGEPPVAHLRIRSPRGTWDIKVDRLPFRIGRRDPRQHHYPELDLAEHDRGIASRHHATIQFSDDVYTLTDLGSTNGTLINNVRIPPYIPQRLRPGDLIKVGEVDMEFRWV